MSLPMIFASPVAASSPVEPDCGRTCDRTISLSYDLDFSLYNIKSEDTNGGFLSQADFPEDNPTRLRIFAERYVISAQSERARFRDRFDANLSALMQNTCVALQQEYRSALSICSDDSSVKIELAKRLENLGYILAYEFPTQPCTATAGSYAQGFSSQLRTSEAYTEAVQSLMPAAKAMLSCDVPFPLFGAPWRFKPILSLKGYYQWAESGSSEVPVESSHSTAASPYLWLQILNPDAAGTHVDAVLITLGDLYQAPPPGTKEIFFQVFSALRVFHWGKASTNLQLTFNLQENRYAKGLDGREPNNDSLYFGAIVAYPLSEALGVSTAASVYQSDIENPSGSRHVTSLFGELAAKRNEPFPGLSHIQGKVGGGKDIGTVQPYGTAVPESIDVIYAEAGGDGLIPIGEKASFDPSASVALNQSDETFFGLYPSWKLGLKGTFQSGPFTSNLTATYSGNRIRLNLNRDTRTLSLTADTGYAGKRVSLKPSLTLKNTHLSGYLPSDQWNVGTGISITATAEKTPGLTASLEGSTSRVTASAEGGELLTRENQVLLNLSYKRPIK